MNANTPCLPCPLPHPQVREEEIDDENRARVEARKAAMMTERASKFADVQVGADGVAVAALLVNGLGGSPPDVAIRQMATTAATTALRPPA